MSYIYNDSILVPQTIYKVQDILKAGKDAKQFWFIRRWFGYKFQMKQVKKYFGIK